MKYPIAIVFRNIEHYYYIRFKASCFHEYATLYDPKGLFECSKLSGAISLLMKNFKCELMSCDDTKFVFHDCIKI